MNSSQIKINYKTILDLFLKSYSIFFLKLYTSFPNYNIFLVFDNLYNIKQICLFFHKLRGDFSFKKKKKNQTLKIVCLIIS